MNNDTSKSLSDIIISIAKSVAQAQSDVEESQLSHLFTFFERKFKKNKKGETTNELLPGIFPKRLKIGIPDSNSKFFKTKYYSVPYINILPITPIHIESIKAEFDISLIGLENKIKNKTSNNEEMKYFKDLPSLKIDVIGAAFGREKGLSAHICLTMSKHELPEGTSRMINELINNAQGYQEDLILQKEEKQDNENNKTLNL
ncbi:hypothetical protein A7X81_08175 [Campylobacter ornithocola]|uniref:Uncharacterized protein n=1 Tax=Campylobacter ornithocola TaxID=1848766 RepID=A0A6M8N006_9BACT|nr:DUF2589 domain-containing protein [Campylobacter ornithocola]OCX43209.1 hypothetical protein A7X81_08175 [Campylobacter ornithocola]QKF56884.1 DUF2589 domain-containing protein [Campylobacter ornithocola]